MPVCLHCNQFFPNRVKIDGKTRNLCARKYCLICSPFNGHNRRKIDPDNVERRHRCSHCGETDPVKFYGRKKYTCARCHRQYCIEKGIEKRRKIVEALGGKCILCGFDKYICSLDVHHLNPALKDMNWSNVRGWRWKKIESEIANCVLLCRNCHSALHCGYITL